MNMRTCNDPYSTNAGLVDKMLGTAYDVVKYVATNMEKLLYVADNMEAVYATATGGTIEKPMVIVPFVGTNYQLVARADDRYKHVRLANTVSVSCHDTTDVLPIGSWFQLKNTGDSSILLQGTTFNLPMSTSPVIRGRGEVRLLKVGINSWDVIGDLVTA